MVVRRPHFQGRRAIAYLNHSGPLPRVGIRKLSTCPKSDGIRQRSLPLLSLSPDGLAGDPLGLLSTECRCSKFSHVFSKLRSTMTRSYPRSSVAHTRR